MPKKLLQLVLLAALIAGPGTVSWERRGDAVQIAPREPVSGGGAELVYSGFGNAAGVHGRLTRGGAFTMESRYASSGSRGGCLMSAD